jgi:16S rRNA (adenine(1408)-N(1))-methyltransferase
MREASWRAARPEPRGGLTNAVFVASALDALPAQLRGIASLVTVHFPWGSLLRAALGQDQEGTIAIARLLAPGGRLRLLVSAADGDAAGGTTDIVSGEVLASYVQLGLEPAVCLPATLADAAEARSSWGKRLLAGGGGRRAFLIELHRP